jgi:peptidoglycan/xylan/chitin deacetylase (PgdA/CDA1 family)
VSDRSRAVIERIADLALRGSGALRLARWLDARDRAALRVLVYHRIADPGNDPLAGDPGIISATPETFDAQMGAVRRYYAPVGVDAVIAALSGGPALPARAVLVTFDDGYRDVMTHAWPVLRSHRVPAVVFVPSAFPDQPARFWWDEVWQLLARTPATRVAIGDGDTLDLGTPRARLLAHRRIVQATRPLAPDAVRARLDGLRAALAGPADAAVMPPPVLGWDELRALARDGLVIASHGRTHASLPSLSEGEIADEIDGADRDFARELGPVPRIFAYPFGHFDARASALLRSRGYVCALSTMPGRNPLPIRDPFAVRRQSVNVMHSPSRIQLGLAGFYPEPFLRLRSVFLGPRPR